jgi:hypothetical protein
MAVDWPRPCTSGGQNGEPENIMATRSSGRPAGKRKVIKPSGRSRYVRRSTTGKFTEDQVKTGRSVARDKKTAAKHSARKGMKDRGD